MPLSRFNEAKILERLEPFGERARYWQAGIIVSNVLNALLKPQTALTADQFMPDLDRAWDIAPQREVPAEDQYAALKAFFEHHNKSIANA